MIFTKWFEKFLVNLSMTEEYINEIIGGLAVKRHSAKAGSEEYNLLSAMIEFAKKWGQPDSMFTGRPPQMQFVHFTVNGQPVDPAAMGGQWNTTQ